MTNAHIILIGMMGSGKTTVGQAVSRAYGIPFTDTDALIEKRLNMTIPRIFEQYGESYFREQEAKAARIAVAESKAAVIATGGGIVTIPKTMALFKQSGFVVYLQLSLDDLQKRTANDQNRPLQSRMEELLIKRRSLYTKYSDLILDGAAPADKLSEMIWNEYRSYKRA